MKILERGGQESNLRLRIRYPLLTVKLPQH